jgi:hypothetical protein
MGQYVAIYNLDQQQVIHPGRFNDGLRLRELGSSSCGPTLKSWEPRPVTASPSSAITPISQAFRKTWCVSPTGASTFYKRYVRMRP